MKRHNAKCKRCKAAHSILATHARRADGCHETVAINAVHAGVWFAPTTLVHVDADGFKHLGHEGGIARVCECGAQLILRPVRGILRTSIKCDARCAHATGHDCECACGGKNHGAAHGVAA